MKRTTLFLTSLPLVATTFLSFLGTPATARPISNRCPEDNPSQFVHAETQNFHIYICGGDSPHVYVGRNKKSDDEITLPLTQTSRRNTYVALNEDYPNIYRYVLTPYQLTVTKNGRIILRENARWWNR